MSEIEAFCDKHSACQSGREWAIYNCPSGTMAEAWEKLPYEWLLWVATRPGVMPDSNLRLFACWCVRNTPLAGRRKTWDLLADPRSQDAVETAERYACGDATDAELDAAWAAAWAAAREAIREVVKMPLVKLDACEAENTRQAALAASYTTAEIMRNAATYVATRTAGISTTWYAAPAAQASYLRSLGNPFVTQECEA